MSNNAGFDSGRGGNWLPMIAVLGVVSAAGLGYFAWTQYELREQQAKLLAQVRESNEALSAALDARESQGGASKQEAVALQGQVDALRAQLAKKPNQAAAPVAGGASPDASAIEAQVRQDSALVAKLKPMIDSGFVSVGQRGGALVLSVASDKVFGKKSAQLNNAGKKQMANLAKQLARATKGRRVTVGAHVGGGRFRNKKFKNDAYAFSSAQAHAVASVLRSSGFKSRSLGAAGFGSSLGSADGRGKKSARIELVVEARPAALASLTRAQASVLR